MSEFLADARVLITPDTTAFRAQLVAELAAATKGIRVAVPVQIAAATQGAAAATRQVAQATQEVAAAQQVAGAAAARRSGAEKELIRVQQANERATRSLALAQGEVTNATTAQAAAQITATRSAAAARSAQRAHELALLSGNQALIQATANTARLAAAQEAEASTALQAARAQGVHAAQLSSTSRGAAASALSLLGVRGATLAANAAFLGGAAAIVAFAKSVSLAASFEEEMNVFKNAVGASEEQMKAAADTARELGRDISLPGVSAVDAAQAITLLARAGLDVEDALDAARGTLQLATAAEIDNAEAVRLVATALNSFNLEGTEAVRVADLLASGANASQAEITDMGLSLQQAAAVANLVGLEVNDTVALLTLLQKAGLRGSDAGTSLRTSLIRLIAPTDKAKDQLASLNLQLRDVEGNLRPEVFAEFIKATEDLGKARQQELIADIFGQDAIRAVALIGEQGAVGLRLIQEELGNTGAAAEAARARTAGFTGDVGALSSNVETLGSALGEVLLPGLEQMTQGLTNATSGAIALSEGIRELGETNIPLVGELGDRFSDLTTVIGPTGFLGAFGGFKVINTVVDQFSDEVDDASDSVSAFDSVGTTVATTLNEIAVALRATVEEAKNAGLGFTQLEGRLAGLREQAVDIDIAGGSQAQVIENLRAQEENLRKQLENENLSTEARRRIKDELAEVGNEQVQIQEDIARDREQAARDVQQAAEKAAREAEQARDAADRAFLLSVDLQEQRIQNKLIVASASAGLQDDINRNRQLREFYRKSIEDVRETVKDAETRAKQIAELTRKIIETNQEIADLRRQQREAQRERREESLALDVQIAEATGNKAAEIAAREREIKDIQERIRATRRESLERKRLILALRQKQAELRELKDAAKETGNAAKELAFEFLQTQQGFAANLLGNLIPPGLTGLVGNGPSETVRATGFDPTAGLEETRAEAAAAGSQGLTRGQGNTFIELQRRVVRSLEDLRRGQGFPEAREQRVRVGGSMDIQ